MQKRIIKQAGTWRSTVLSLGLDLVKLLDRSKTRRQESLRQVRCWSWRWPPLRTRRGARSLSEFPRTSGPVLKSLNPGVLENTLFAEMNVDATTAKATTAKAGKSYWRGRLSTVDLLIKIGCFVNKEKYSFSMKRSWSELVSTRRSIVLILLLQQGFPGQDNLLVSVQQLSKGTWLRWNK